MTSDRQRQITELYHAALGRDGRDRAAFLREACAGNDALRREVESLLGYEDAAAPFLERPAIEEVAPLVTSRPESTGDLAGRRIGVYQIEARIGAGGMGEVYRARDTKLGRDVAIKVLPSHLMADADRRARFEREARLLATLNHSNIAQVHGLEESEGLQALVMELVPGETLEELCAGGSPGPALPLDQTLLIARQIADALDAAHEKGIIHRDLKPGNVMIQGSWGATSPRDPTTASRPRTPRRLEGDLVVKVLDFGLAKATAGDAPGPDLTQLPTITADGTRHGVILGTPAYMSPEQARGKPMDKRTDIWAFGCVLYEMLTGRRAFAGETTSDTIAAILEREPDWSVLPAALPASLRAFLRRCLRKDPRERVRDIGDIRLALDDTVDAPAPVDVDLTAGRAKRRRVLAWSAATALISGATALAVWMLMPPRRHELPITFVLAAPEGSAFSRVTMAPQPALSSDGRQLAFVAPFQSRSMIWIQRIGAPEARPLPGTEGGSFPFWSPDGQFVGFSAQGRVRKIAASGERAPQDLCMGSAAPGGTWSARGVVIFPGPAGLYRVSSDGGSAEPVTSLDPARGEYSHRLPYMLPDGKRFVYVVRSSQPAQRGLYLGSLDDPALKRRLLPDDSNAAYGTGPDGRGHLFYVREGALLAHAFDVSRGELVADPVVIVRPVVPGETGRFAPFAVAERTLVYLVRPRSRNRLRWMDRSGAALGDLGDAGDDYTSPALSPDGTKLAVALTDPQVGKPDIHVFDVRQRTSERLTVDPIGAWHPTWMPTARTSSSRLRGRGRGICICDRRSGATADSTVYQAPEPSAEVRPRRHARRPSAVHKQRGSVDVSPSRGGSSTLVTAPGLGAGLNHTRARLA